MFEFQLLLQRRRKMMVVLLLGAAATLAILPRADAKVSAIVPVSDVSLLSPEPIWGPRFSLLQLPTP